MLTIPEAIHQMSVNAEALRVLLQSISAEQAAWKPDPQTWSFAEVAGHLYVEELGDFRCHLREVLHNPPLAWGALQPGPVAFRGFDLDLGGFLTERQSSIAWLSSLPAVAWDAAITASFGPASERVTFTAGDLLAAWVAHDFLHIRQVNELHFAWNAHRAAPYGVRYAGDW